MFISVTQKYKWLVALEAFILLNGVPALAYTGAIPGSSRYLLAFVVLGLVGVRFIRESWTLETLGLKGKWGHNSLRDHVLWALLGVFLIFVFFHNFALSREVFSITTKTILFSFVISFVQELIFRSYLIESLERLSFSKFAIYTISATSFAIIHLFFETYLWALVPMCFLYGLLTCWLYLKYRNLTLLTLNHFAVNLFAAHFRLVEADPILSQWLHN
mgnify:CR=1 FL=1